MSYNFNLPAFLLISRVSVSNLEEDPVILFLFSAQNASVEGMEKAMSKDPQVLLMCDPLQGMSALHLAAASPQPNAVDAVRWLLKKGIRWDMNDRHGLLPEDWARMYENEECRMVLRNWAIESGDAIRVSKASSLPSPQNTSYITTRSMAAFSVVWSWTRTRSSV